mgnify:CR=1 FL=1
MGTLDGKVGVITGGRRGIGRVTAELFAQEGASLALCGRTQATLDAAAKEIASTHGTRVFTQVADIMDNASVGRFAQAVEREFGRADILVNNAGESSQRAVDGINWPVNAVDAPGQKLPAGRFERITDEEWREALEQKVLGMIRVTRAFLPILRKGRGAAIVNITSIKGRQPPPRVVTSGVAWAASMNFSKAGRRKWAPEKTLEEFLAPRVANIPLARLGTVEEVAHAILFLASPNASYITGQCLSVDGGGVRMI